MSDQTKIRARVLIFIEWFTPAHKAGGPIRSIENLIRLLESDFDFYVYCSDRDLGDQSPLKNIITDRWIKGSSDFQIRYTSLANLDSKGLKLMIADIQPHIVYFNSMYAFRFFLLPLFQLKRMGYKGKIVLSPRGMLRATAIKFKSPQKKLFLTLFRYSFLLRNIFFHATDEQEKSDIQKWLHIPNKRISIIHNVPFIPEQNNYIFKSAGELNLIFVGRMHPIKGFDFVLEVLKKITTKIKLVVVGWIENRDFFEKCLEKIKALPDKIKVEIWGDKPFNEVKTMISQSHFLILPTHGENFGHAIFEALALGRPVIISDETPWKNLETKRIGWDIPLQKPEQFVKAVERASQMDQNEYDQWSDQSFSFAKKFISSGHLKEQYTELFVSARDSKNNGCIF